jgi:hypothetical protein
MARQYFNDGPINDPMFASPTALTALTIQPMWVAALWTPILANDARPGKIYCVRAGGLISNNTAGSTIIVTPKYGTGGTTLGASPAQQMAVMSGIPWSFNGELVVRSIGVGAASTAVFTGTLLLQGTLATPGTGVVVPCGGTVPTNLDFTILSNIEINTTISGAGTFSMQPQYAYIFSRN